MTNWHVFYYYSTRLSLNSKRWQSAILFSLTSGKKKKKVEREIEYRKTDESVIEPRRLKKQELRREIQGDDQVQRGEATQLERERERERWAGNTKREVTDTGEKGNRDIKWKRELRYVHRIEGAPVCYYCYQFISDVLTAR